jgi:hypothetical protein
MHIGPPAKAGFVLCRTYQKTDIISRRASFHFSSSIICLPKSVPPFLNLMRAIDLFEVAVSCLVLWMLSLLFFGYFPDSSTLYALIFHPPSY